MSIETGRFDPLAFVDTPEALMENPYHTAARDEIARGLRFRFRGQPAYIANGLAIQYDPTDTGKVISADVFVALHPPEGGFPRVNRSWTTWEHGIPTVVIEVASTSTVGNDQGKKFRIYQKMGVEEYFLFDPRFDELEESSLQQPLLGHRREGGVLHPIARPLGYESPLLGLRLEVEGGILRFTDLESGMRIPTEEEARSQAEEAQAQAEEASRRIAELEAEIERLKRERG